MCVWLHVMMVATVTYALVLATALIQTSNAFTSNGTGESDRITNLPGLTFQFPVNQYAGHLNASKANDFTYQHYLHYWFVESQSDPDHDPIVLWLNGGPGCTSIGGSLEELGPFHPNKDGQTLFENIYTWNKKANYIFLDSPVGVGYSYAVDGNINTTDEQTSDDLVRALTDFFTVKFPNLKGRDFFISGESYAGVYLPMLAARIVMLKDAFPAKLRGMAVGNGFMNEKYLTESLVIYLWSHGVMGDDMFNKLNAACNCTNHNLTCPYFNHIRPLNVDGSQESDGTQCGDLVYQWSGGYIFNAQTYPSENNAYNLYDDCYTSDGLSLTYAHRQIKTIKKVHSKLFQYLDESGYDTPKLFNYDSTDTMNGFLCWNGGAATTYMNLPAVRTALHIDGIKELEGLKWADCNNDLNSKYYRTSHFDMTPEFDTILQNSDVHILVYNGDVDTTCNFLGDGWFIEKVAADHNLPIVKERQPWYYRGQIGGYVKQYNRIDLLTVKGAGHFVPASRAGPSMQMITNLFDQIDVTNQPKGAINYSLPIDVSTTFRPPVESASTTPKACTCGAEQATKTSFLAITVLLSLLFTWLFV